MTGAERLALAHVRHAHHFHHRLDGFVLTAHGYFRKHNQINAKRLNRFLAHTLSKLTATSLGRLAISVREGDGRNAPEVSRLGALQKKHRTCETAGTRGAHVALKILNFTVSFFSLSH